MRKEQNEKVKKVKEAGKVEEIKEEEGSKLKEEHKETNVATKIEKTDNKREENKENKENKQVKTEKKKSKKTIIVLLIVLIIAILVGTSGYFIYEYIETNRSVGTIWGDTYYAYLKEATEQKDFGEIEKYGLRTDMENTKLEFCEIEENRDPIMIITYTNDDKDYVNVYHISEEGRVINVDYKEPSKVEFLYNISTQEYNWYIHTEDNIQDSYKTLKSVVNDLNNGTQQEENTMINETKTAEIEAEYTIKKDEVTTVEKIDGTTIMLSKFDETFIEPEIDENKKVHLDVNSENQKELKQTVKETVDGYKTEKQIVTEEVKAQVTEKIAAVETKKQEMEIAKEERIKKEEEEMKITAENVQAKIGEHLKWASLVYLGADYGLPTVYQIKDVTGTVTIPGVDNSYLMTEEIVGLKSIQSLKNQIATYISSSAISKLGQSIWGSYTQGLKEYNGKVYLVRGGIGDGPSIDIKKAKVLSSENGISKIQLSDINVLGDILEATITLTVEYNRDIEKYMIVDCSIKQI